MWFFLRVRNIPLIKEKSKNSFFRKLSKGNSSFYGYSNKSFFKDNVEGGFYRNNIYDLNNNLVEYVFYIKTKEIKNKRTFVLNLKFRIRKMGISDIDIQEVNEDEVISLKGCKFYQTFGSCYFN